jgi:hypothetical protein
MSSTDRKRVGNGQLLIANQTASIRKSQVAINAGIGLFAELKCPPDFFIAWFRGMSKLQLHNIKHFLNVPPSVLQDYSIILDNYNLDNSKSDILVTNPWDLSGLAQFANGAIPTRDGRIPPDSFNAIITRTPINNDDSHHTEYPYWSEYRARIESAPLNTINIGTEIIVNYGNAYWTSESATRPIEQTFDISRSNIHHFVETNKSDAYPVDFPKVSSINATANAIFKSFGS